MTYDLERCIYIKIRLELSIADYVGKWKTSRWGVENSDVVCIRSSDDTIKCKFLHEQEFVTFIINGATITNKIDPDIRGINQGNGKIIWHKGSQFFSNWDKQGIRDIINHN